MKHSTRKSSLIFLFCSFVVCATAQFFIRPNYGNFLVPPGDDPYKKFWSEVDSLERNGLTESANKVVGKIRLLAENDKNSVQLIKSFFYSAKYRDVLEEESYKTNMDKLDEMITKSSVPVQQLLYSVKAELIYNYYLANLWKINQRTPIQGDTETDMDKWDGKRFAREAMKFYEKSLTNSKDLQNTQLEGYRDILAATLTLASA